MKSFRGTLLFAIVVCSIAGYAIYEYTQEQKEEVTKLSQNHLYPDIKVEDVAAVEFSSPVTRFKIQREDNKSGDNDWEMVQPVEDRADGSQVKTMIRTVIEQNVEKVAESDTKIDWAKYGLASPQGSYIFTLTNGKTYKFEFGTVRSYDQGIYIKKENESTLYLADKGFESSTQKMANDLRSKVVNFPSGEVQRISIHYSTPDKSAKFDLEKADGQWLYSQNKSMKLSNAEVEEYINILKQVHGDTIISDDKSSSEIKKNNLTQPNVNIAVEMSDADKKLKTITLAFNLDKSTEAAMISSENKPIYKLAKTRVEGLLKNIALFRDRTYLFTFNTSEAHRVSLVDGSKNIKFNFVQKGEKWEDSSSPSAQVDGTVVRSLISDLTHLRAVDFLEHKPTIQLNNSIQVQDQKGNIIFNMKFAVDSKADQSYIVQTNLSPEFVHITKSSIDSLFNKKFVVPENPILKTNGLIPPSSENSSKSSQKKAQ